MSRRDTHNDLSNDKTTVLPTPKGGRVVIPSFVKPEAVEDLRKQSPELNIVHLGEATKRKKE